MEFLIETLKGASLHVHAVWLALTYIAVILAMSVDFVAGLRKARAAGIASNSRGYKMTSVILPAPFFTMLMGGFNIFCEWKSVMESTHDKQEMRDAANTLNVIVKNKDDIAAIVMQAMDLMVKKQELESNNNNINPNTIENETESNEHQAAGGH